MTDHSPSTNWGAVSGFALLIAVFAAFWFATAGGGAAERAMNEKAIAFTFAKTDSKGKPKVNTETAMFGAGCFWGVEVTFRNVPGVIDAAVGYTGGKTENPTYQEVCTDTTGHAEVVYVEYDPTQVSYEKLLEVFFANHNPTQLNYQGPDHGTQYRSAIFTYSLEQEKAAKAMIEKLTAEKRFGKPIVTQIEPAKPFYKAEEYHQRYLEKRGLASCHI